MNKLRNTLSTVALTVPLVFSGALLGTSCASESEKTFESPQDQIYDDITDTSDQNEFKLRGLIVGGLGLVAVGAAVYALRNDDMLDPTQDYDPENYDQDF